MHFIRLENLNIEYNLSGNKENETILFVHGLGANLNQFEKQHEYFSDSFQVLSINLRGHGESSFSYQPNQPDFTLSAMREDVIKVLDHLAIEQVHFVGNSMGGNVGYELLKSHPSRLKTFTTFGTTAELQKSKLTIVLMRTMYKLLSSRTLGSLSSSSGNTAYSKQLIKKMMSQMAKSTVLAIIPNIANFNYLAVIRNSKVPAMIIKGGKDQEINKVIGSTIEEFEQRGNFQLRNMTEAGHFANLDNPEQFNQLLEDFYNNH
ncbi:alpha/beta fold hydrolase [Tunicatimonas pelagia]|uniref:alpha/beta fold hydrolase n=1 Tax=Tunicatimonas pelagia TaxID=931531 RepID=UPI002665A4C7|nr:alpha/beta hydrolase [Tunicatimonas pelagia]WKN45490.1 alpha/beta hydrolase [Tunicatimonas pelagia]